MRVRFIVAVVAATSVGACGDITVPTGAVPPDTSPEVGDSLAVDTSTLYLAVHPDTVFLRIRTDSAWASAVLLDSSDVLVDSAHYLWNPPRGQWRQAVAIGGGLRAQTINMRALLPGTFHYEVKGDWPRIPEWVSRPGSIRSC